MDLQHILIAIAFLFVFTLVLRATVPRRFVPWIVWPTAVVVSILLKEMSP